MALPTTATPIGKRQMIRPISIAAGFLTFGIATTALSGFTAGAPALALAVVFTALDAVTYHGED
tara:strand:- start:2205 stop:2396 length:192 start_codon:yes stop_codon:yes gene_type:complete